MSTEVQETTNGSGEVEKDEKLMYFAPEEIIVDDEINARPYSSLAGETEDEQKAIDELAASIAAHGQQHPVRVRLDADGKPHLIMGSRRRKAVMRLNASNRLADAASEIKLSAVAVHDLDDDKAYQDAIIENLHRRNPSPMDFMLVIQSIRQRHGWEGQKGTKKVADYLKTSPATVTQHDKLAKLESEFQDKVHKGELTLAGALDLMNYKAEDRQKVYEAGKTKKRKETENEAGQANGGAVVDAASDQETGAQEDGGDRGTRKRSTASSSAGQGKGRGVRKSKAVGSRHIKEGAKAAGVEAVVKKALSKAEVLAFFEDYHGANPAEYGYPDSPLQEFLNYFLHSFVTGQGTARTLDRYWNEVIRHAPKGSADSVKIGKAETQTDSTAGTIAVSVGKPKKKTKVKTKAKTAKAKTKATAKKKSVKSSKKK